MKVFESDLAEALFEIIANTGYKSEGEQFLKDIRVNEYNIELDMDNAKITLSNEDESFEVIFHKTHVNKLK